MHGCFKEIPMHAKQVNKLVAFETADLTDVNFSGYLQLELQENSQDELRTFLFKYFPCREGARNCLEVNKVWISHYLNKLNYCLSFRDSANRIAYAATSLLKRHKAFVPIDTFKCEDPFRDYLISNMGLKYLSMNFFQLT